jgi:hypothetical protein
VNQTVMASGFDMRAEETGKSPTKNGLAWAKKIGALLVLLSIPLFLVTTPALAEWTQFGKNSDGDQFFVDISSVKRGAKPRGWFMLTLMKPTSSGNFSFKHLFEADCGQDRIRILAYRAYELPMGGGSPSASSDQADGWVFADPGSTNEITLEILCGKRSVIR